jgi:hypothetical protein
MDGELYIYILIRFTMVYHTKQDRPRWKPATASVTKVVPRPDQSGGVVLANLAWPQPCHLAPGIPEGSEMREVYVYRQKNIRKGNNFKNRQYAAREYQLY